MVGIGAICVTQGLEVKHIEQQSTLSGQGVVMTSAIHNTSESIIDEAAQQQVVSRPTPSREYRGKSGEKFFVKVHPLVQFINVMR